MKTQKKLLFICILLVNITFGWSQVLCEECSDCKEEEEIENVENTEETEGAGGPIEAPTPATVAATSSDSSSRDSTLKETTKPSKPKTNTTNTKGPAAVSDEQFPATETKAENKNNKKKRGEKTMWVAIFQCFNCGKRGHDLTKCTRCEETCTHCSTTSSSPLLARISTKSRLCSLLCARETTHCTSC